jgi:3'-phosphoadenosine 5'-phosphosulfate sulfotransferase (PAPS reductase)/FAD synthetase
MTVENVISLSGGKDSTALALMAIERQTENLTFAFADTGHEHAQTYEYVDYLDGELRKRCGVGITRVRADFSQRIARKRETVQTKWRAEGVPESRIENALALLVPTGVPFLDLCLLKGRFPSTRARFCSQELKHIPIQQQVFEPLMDRFDALVSWQGVRADESKERAKLPERDVEFGAWEPEPVGVLIYRPLIRWTADDVFAMHRKHGVRWNPLYEQGMSRVGCMPCIMANKAELREIAKRFPDEVARVNEWERLVAGASKRGVSSFFASDKTPGEHVGRADLPMPGIHEVMDWALTGRGGRNFDMFHVMEAQDDAPSCSSVYGLCE